ncbi:MAG: response regulator [Akkermansiaceae bacterium]|nr:response regulator [Akkermansiaceae bacterium]
MNSTLLEPQQKQSHEMDAVEILLVEDNENDAALTIRALKKRNLANNLIHVNDGQQALDFIFAKGEYAGRDPLHLPKVVLLDLKLPKVNGLEVLRQLKAKEATKIIPIVMLSSSQEESDLNDAYKMGANSYIVKPVEFDNFSEAISHMGLYWLVLNKRPKSC